MDTSEFYQYSAIVLAQVKMMTQKSEVYVKLYILKSYIYIYQEPHIVICILLVHCDIYYVCVRASALCVDKINIVQRILYSNCFCYF